MLTDNSAAPLILIVEDDESHAELIMRSFETAPEEYRLHSAKALHAARNVMAMHRPNLVLTDYRLPDGDGGELVAMANEDCPVIMMTSHGSEQVAVDAMKAGAQDYVVKSGAVFSALPRIAGRALREWALMQEHKRFEDALRKSRNALAEAQRIAHIGSWELDLVDNKLDWSDEIFRIFEIDKEQFGASYEAFLAAVHPDDRDMVDRIYTESLKKRLPYEIEHRLLFTDGRIKYVQERCETSYGSDGTPLRSVGIVQDITERKAAEEEQQKLQAQLLQARKMESVGRLAGGVAHDFNNMLGIIIGYTEMAQTRVSPDQPIFADLLEIQQAAERSAALTQQLLAFARKQIVVPKVLDLNDTVTGMFKMLRRLIGEEIDLVWLPEEGLWPVKVDPSQIDQILVNLCVNARDAITGMGTITIETRTATLDDAYCAGHPGAVPGEYVLLTVSDNGSGMDKETLDRLFEPFFTTKELGKGTGLGLATVFGIVKQNDGFINVYSEPGHGTSFKIYLPRFAAGTGQTAKKENLAAPDVHGNETILLVEDESSLLTMASLMLKSLGYLVLTASTPGEAIRVSCEHDEDIHLLLTDVIMPEMNGLDLSKELASHYPGMVCLFMSGYTGTVITQCGILGEETNFIQKPFSIPELAAKVRAALDSKP